FRSPLWIGPNAAVDGPDEDPFKHVWAGEDLLAVEPAGNEAAASRAVTEVQEALNQVLPRKRDLATQVNQLLEIDGRFKNDSRERAALLARGFHRAGAPAVGLMQPASTGEFEPIVNPVAGGEFTGRDVNPYFYQLHPTVRAYLRVAYGLDAD